MPRRLRLGLLPVSLLLAGLLSAALPGIAAGCACCAYPGQWSTEQMAFPIDHGERDWFVGQLQKLRLTGRVVPASPARAAVLLPANGRIVGRYVPARRGFRFETRGETGRLLATELDVADGYEEFKTDTGRRDPAGMVKLYKEWRFPGQPSSHSAEPATVAGERQVVLVLQGEGNNCPDIRDFSHWVMHFAWRDGRSVEPVVAYGQVEVAD